MSIKLALLKSGEQVITDLKELVSEDKVRGYLFNNPQRIEVNKSCLLTEDEMEDGTGDYQLTFSSWIILTEDKEMVVPIDWVVTIVEPLQTVVEMYQEKLNG